jgi:hypothetical protein
LEQEPELPSKVAFRVVNAASGEQELIKVVTSIAFAMSSFAGCANATFPSKSALKMNRNRFFIKIKLGSNFFANITN